MKITSSLTKEQIVDKIKGAIYGNALGDAVGLATEFMSKPEVENAYGKNPTIPFPDYQRNYHNSRWTKGDWTDDTDQMLLIMLSITEKQPQNRKVDFRDFGIRLIKWGRQGFPELGDYAGMGMGYTVSRVLSHKQFLTDPHLASHEVWAGSGFNLAANGAVMRTSVVGCIAYDDSQTVLENTLNLCKVTHSDTRCIASCVAVTTVIANILQGKYINESNNNNASDINLDQVMKDAMEASLVHLDPKYHAEFEQHMNANKIEDLDLDEEKSIGYTFKCVGSAFWSLRQKSMSFKEVINAVVREAGDADTNGAVCGALVGVRIGYANLPQDWLAAMPHKGWLDQKVNAFLKYLNLE